MTFLLAITDFSTGEGVYTADMVAALAPRLGYDCIAGWDRGLHGWPLLRAAALEAGLLPILGCRFTWRGMEFGAFPHSNRGYAELCRLLTDQAHGREGDPPRDCVLLAEALDGQEYLAREGFNPHLLAHNRNQMEAMKATSRGLPAVAPQVLRFRREAGLELHRLKRAMAQRSTITRTEALWDPRDAAVDRASWESRYPGAEPVITRATAEILEKVRGWRLHWGGWVMPRPICPRDLDLDDELQSRIRQGIPRRYPVLASLLSESYGVLVYQEDVVRVGMAMAGWTHEEADKLRKILGKPDCSVKLPSFEVKFREGCSRQGIPSAVVDEVWDMVRTFRGYSFCKPHSASYAQVSFESAWIIPDSLEALARVREHPDAFDLVVTDMTRPRMTGLDLASALRRTRPNLPIVLCSGYGQSLVRDHGREAHFRGFIQKPYTTAQVAQTIRAALAPV